MSYLFAVTVVNIICVGNCWDLSLLKVSPSYYVSSIAIYKNRAFITLPRSSCFNNVTNPTLVEVQWLSNYKYSIFGKKMYPNYKHQRWGTCNHVQDSVSVDVEAKGAKLWVLDKGNDKCSAKIVIYNLYYNNIAQTIASGLTDDEDKKLSTIVVDPESNEFGTKAYVGGLEDQILVFATGNLKCSKLKFSKSDGVNVPVSTQYLAMSKIDSALYISGTKNANLYELDLDGVRHLEEAMLTSLRETTNEVKIISLGEQLGPSTGMGTDLKGGLNYYLPRYYAVLRWNTGKPLRAESHEVLTQSYETLPYVSQIFNGPQGEMWALVNPSAPQVCDIKEKKQFVFPKGMPMLKNRLVRLLQLNKNR